MSDSELDRSVAQDAFARLKPTCVALLGKSALTPASTSSVLALLTTLLDTLYTVQFTPAALTPSLINYVFFPLSTILRRNPGSSIPDQVLEQILRVLALLCEEWWWTCEVDVWEQIWMLAGSVLVDGMGHGDAKGKSKARDDETKEAAVCCLLALLHERSAGDSHRHAVDAEERFRQFRERALEQKTLPILGRTLSSLLDTSLSSQGTLQQRSLRLLRILLTSYFDTGHVPSFLPGVVSVMCKVALGEGRSSYQRGEIVKCTLEILDVAIEKAIGNDVCRRAGPIHKITGLDDLRDLGSAERGAGLMSPSPEGKPDLFHTPRTESWYRGTSSQLLLALNSLVPLLKHPNQLALQGMAELYGGLLITCSDSLPDTLQLLLSALLTLSLSDYPSVCNPARHALVTSLSSSPSAMSTLVQVAYSNLSVLPTFIPSGLDEKIQYAAAQVEGTCKLASEKSLDALSSGVKQLLGPNGGIEKWGVSLLYSLRFEVPSVVPLVGADRLLTSSEPATFPPFLLRNVSSLQTMAALERMLRSLGSAGGEEALFAAEWFVGVAKGGRTSKGVAALWCAGRLLEGVAGVLLGVESPSHVRRSERLSRFSKWLAREIADQWDPDEDDETTYETLSEPDYPSFPVERRTGFSQIQKLLELRHNNDSESAARDRSPVVYVALSLELVALASQILSTSFGTLFLHVLYPVLQSVVSTIPTISYTGMCCLQVITQSTGYASPANLLLSNFDYALDAASHRLTRSKLDLQATAVLITLIRIVGKDVVDRAGDVIEECFDRLDEFHGYGVLVEGLMEVLAEVISVLEPEESSRGDRNDWTSDEAERMLNGFEAFLEWHSRRDVPEPADEVEDMGPTPQVPWSETRPDQTEEEGSPEEETPTSTPAQLLAKQIVAKSMYFLTHGSPLIRARVLSLLSSATSLLRESDLLPHVHSAWPFVLNRLDDPEAYVACEAATLIRGLTEHVGDFMTARVWEDVWPRFRKILLKLDAADASNALAKRTGSLSAATAYSASHQLYSAIVGTMTAAVSNVQIRDDLAWEVGLLFRRFLQRQAAEDLQALGRQFYIALGRSNADTVWLLLVGTMGEADGVRLPRFLMEPTWHIIQNTRVVMEHIV